MIRALFFIFLLIHCTLAQNKQQSKTWLTLDGSEPVVIARGGYSGLFPDSSKFAFQFAKNTSLPNVILFCDLQLTKDGQGICLTSLQLDNSTTISFVFPNEQKSYSVNGHSVPGWFALDYTYHQLHENISLTQSIHSRTHMFDGALPISSVEDVIELKPPHFWLNVEYASFYAQHKLDPASYVEKALRTKLINYISSPEIGFLKTLHAKVNKTKTNLIFRFLEKDSVEPTTKQKYGSILANLSDIKSFASGILVPKEYIWPVSKGLYLEAATTLVADAHKQGLHVYASGFANDNPASYNYSYDPIAEYLQFIDNSWFSVDGVLTDFPSTASESIACLAHNKNATRPSKGPLIISRNGASGTYPGCTNLAYEQAINDGADIIDCSVQMSKDGVPFCLDSVDLSGETNALSAFLSRSTKIPEIQQENGIFSFDLTWSEIQTLKPQVTNPFQQSGMKTNPVNNDKGRFVTLSAFLELARTKAVTGILINIQNAAYLASQKGISITDIVTSALSNATTDKHHTQKVLIQSDDTQVLSKFTENPNYQKVLFINETISAAPKMTVDEIKKHADAVSVPRSSIVKSSNYFATAFTSVVDDMHAANVSVYAFPFRNEFVNMEFDYFADPMVELATYIAFLKVDGVITEFPATANAYLRSPCSNLEANISYSILPVQPGSLLRLVPAEVMPPAEAPAPVLSVADIVHPPPPPAATNTSASTPATAPARKKSHSGVPSNAAHMAFGLVAIMLTSLVSVCF
ncbi:glycerophosphodiester phosphodiesterase GDPDL6-like [Actinidia eriantha]|uniref:glycerophosphodiester phosphodiesterase GDPDL6-like n=1 Tax=Actinidia eriantha TaxID=165200 RepID=UPI00258A5179|nr:glycerophosphodiester phosphodiesterase GDPDL6-like [Actinidia eriantha]